MKEITFTDKIVRSFTLDEDTYNDWAESEGYAPFDMENPDYDNLKEYISANYSDHDFAVMDERTDIDEIKEA